MQDRNGLVPRDRLLPPAAECQCRPSAIASFAHGSVANGARDRLVSLKPQCSPSYTVHLPFSISPSRLTPVQPRSLRLPPKLIPPSSLYLHSLPLQDLIHFLHDLVSGFRQELPSSHLQAGGQRQSHPQSLQLLAKIAVAPSIRYDYRSGIIFVLLRRCSRVNFGFVDV